MRPLELWDALIGATPLYLLAPGLIPGAIAQLVAQLAEGSARRLRAHTRLPKLVIDQVVLAGGGPLVATQAALCARGIDATIASDPAWIAEPGGRALLQTLHAEREGAVLDVGQTALKLSDRTGRLRLARPLDEVPLELDARDPERAADFRARTIAFISSAFRARTPPAALVLALPCEIEDDLSVAGCSYPWPAGDTALIREIMQTAQLGHVPCLVLNDAELAAISVDLTRPHEQRTLVLTLGLGLGAAYL